MSGDDETISIVGRPQPVAPTAEAERLAAAPARPPPVRDLGPSEVFTGEPKLSDDIDTSAFELISSRLRFLKRDTETMYRSWHAANAIPFVRIAQIASFPTWGIGLLAIRAAAPSEFSSAVLLVLGVLFPVVCGALAMTYSTRWLRWMPLMALLSNVVAGMVGAIIGWWILGMPEMAMGVAIITAFIGFTIVRLPPLQVTAGVASYVVVLQLLLLHGWLSGSLGVGQAALYSVLLWSAVTFGVLDCIVLDQLSRSAYRDERIGALQQELIDRLRRAELQRQVAERSRDLSHALARLADGPRTAERLASGNVVDGRYRIVRAIRAGGMGEVHEVERLADRRRLALKVLTGVADPRALARFAREAQLAAELDHPNVVPAIDVGVTAEGTLFLVMPLVTGSSLDRARDRYGDLAWAQSIVAQISDALVAMHERGIVHRDLKPSNVLLDGDRVKVTDFGISNVMATASGDATPDGDTALAPAAPLTRTGHLVGTPRYMAPELAGSVREAGPAADIFSLGVIAYELFSSKLPYTAPPIYERLAGRTPEPPPVLATLVPTLPSELAELVDRCLASSIDIRPSARELAVAFRRDRA